MPKSRDQLFETLTTEGALLPSDFLQRLAQRDGEVPGLTPDAYHLGSGERVNEAVSRSWNRLLAVWKNFTVAVGQLPESDPGTTLTREKWLLPFFQELGYGRVSIAKPFEFEGRRYSISHIWQNTPIHLVSFRADLDTRSENIIGARTTTPHSMVQEFLNRSEGHLWGIVSNGYRLRLLRDNASLTRQAYVEFDLQSMMQGEVFADFALLWLLLHQSRVEGERPELCWLERWTQEARQRGARALDQLRDGVQDAISDLGSGFLAHPANTTLRDKLNTGTLTKQDYFRQLLRIVYRFLFLFVAEDRELLFTDQVPAKTREQYLRHYSMSRLRRMALRLGGTQHADLWHVVRLVFQSLGSDTGCAALGLPGLGSFLWSDKATADLNDCQLANRDLLQAIRALAFAEQNKVRRPIDYKNIGTEELGSVYESLLEQHPDVHVPTAKFTLGTHAGHERKTTGSYYTPPSLVQCLLDSALEPMLAEVCKKPNPGQAILSLKVCDKACGSGHFLIAAAHRIARRLAAVRTGEDEPPPSALRHALRDVIGRCIYGVDINPMAVELCKFALWLEAVEPGKPLSFLDHHIQCGNSLIGATPALMKQGIPDKAFEAIEGDDKKYCAQFKKVNKDEATQMQLFAHDNRPWEHLGNLAVNVAQLASLPDDTVADVHAKERRYAELVRSGTYESGRQLADAWCAAFVWKKRKQSSPEAKDGFDYPITNDIFRRLERNPRDCPPWMREEIRRLADQYQFFHWHLAFPDVFQVPTTSEQGNSLCGWNGGFDVMLGNPPWERVKLQEKEWFAERRPDIANAPNAAARKQLVEALATQDPTLYVQFQAALRRAEGESHILRNSGLYPLCGRGDINLYAVFAEGMRSLLNGSGCVGAVLPSGIATSDTTKEFFGALVEEKSLRTIYMFDYRADIFPGVSTHFCLISWTATGDNDVFESAAELMTFEDLLDRDRRYRLCNDDIRLLNPHTRTCPIFRSRYDAELTKRIYIRTPVFSHSGEAQGWQPEFFKKMVDFGIHASLLTFAPEQPTPDSLPVYEARMVSHFNHRFSTYAGVSVNDREGGNARELTTNELMNPEVRIAPRCWIRERDFFARMQGRNWPRQWFLSMRDVTNSTNERSGIFAIRPFLPGNDLLPTIFVHHDPSLIACLFACLCSFALDYAVRQKLSGVHLNAFVASQLAVVPPKLFADRCPWERRPENSAGSPTTVQRWLLPRVLELTYTAWDLEPFARDCGYDGPPFCWDEERRFLLRCELDAAFFHLYGINRDDAAYILDTFPIVKRKDEAKWGTYRTKDTILEIYAALAEAQRTGQPYQTRLNPAPADSRVAHPPRFAVKERINYDLPADYILQLVFALLRRSGGRCDVILLARAYALLAEKQNLGRLADIKMGSEARKWIEACTQKLDEDWFLPTLRQMESRGMVRFRVEGEEVIVASVDAKGPPANPTVESDADVLAQVLELATDVPLPSMPKLLPDRPTALFKATLETA